ncbi:hypothetical protein EV715DRAFT_263403 [Schizophyllum commune]
MRCAIITIAFYAIASMAAACARKCAEENCQSDYNCVCDYTGRWVTVCIDEECHDTQTEQEEAFMSIGQSLSPGTTFENHVGRMRYTTTRIATGWIEGLTASPLHLVVLDLSSPVRLDCAYHCGIDVCTPETPLYDPTCDFLFASNHVNSYVASCMQKQCPRDQKDVAFGTL